MAEHTSVSNLSELGSTKTPNGGRFQVTRVLCSYEFGVKVEENIYAISLEKLKEFIFSQRFYNRISYFFFFLCQAREWGVFVKLILNNWI